MRAFVVALLLFSVFTSACGTRSSGPTTCEQTRCAPACRPAYYGEDPSGCGVCLCGSKVCPPLACDPGDLGADAGLPVDDAGCPRCSP